MKKCTYLFPVLLLALVLCFTACGSDKKAETDESVQVSAEAQGESGAVSKTGIWENAACLTDTEIGQGAATVVVGVTAEGQSVKFTVHTDEKTVGAALLANNIIAGDEGPYGLYVKVVNGMTADYDTDKSYWSFNINGEMAMTGVDKTDITDGDVYEFVYTK